MLAADLAHRQGLGGFSAVELRGLKTRLYLTRQLRGELILQQRWVAGRLSSLLLLAVSRLSAGHEDIQHVVLEGDIAAGLRELLIHGARENLDVMFACSFRLTGQASVPR